MSYNRRLKFSQLKDINTNLSISNLFYIFVYIIKKILSMIEWDWNRIYTKKEIAEIIFPQLSQKYAWNLISELCQKQGKLMGLFRSNRRYVLPNELKIIVKALNSEG